jgi:hypothetical protein
MGRRCTVAALQPPLSTRLAGAWCLLVVRCLRRYALPEGYLFTLIARRPLGLQGTRGGPRAARARKRELEPQGTWWPRSCPGLGSGSWSRRTRGGPRAASGWAAGAGAAGHVAAPELPRAGQRELEPQGTWWPRSCPSLGSGSWSRRTRGGPGAASGWAAGAEAAGHVAAPKPTSVGRRGPELQLAWQRVDTRLAPCLDLELVCGGTLSSGYRQRVPTVAPGPTSGEAANPQVGPIFQRPARLS